MAEARAAPLVFVAAGEHSGDLIAGRLMAALREATDDRVTFQGIGGQHMEAQGLASLFPMSSLSVMGMLEVAPHVPRLLRLMHRTAHAIRSVRPDVVVTVDSPGFNLRVTERLRGEGIPLMHYVAPTVWAYRRRRAQRIARFLDHILCLYPFEPPYFTAVGLAATCVGHPLVEEGIERGDGAAFRARHGISADERVLAALPGSRARELRIHLPVFRATIEALPARLGGALRVVVPAVPDHAAAVREAVAGWSVPTTVIEGTGEKYGAFAASDAAIVVSGTATLELVLARVPMAICYRANPLTAAVLRRVIRLTHLGLPNIIADDGVVPEFLQENFTPTRIAPALAALLSEETARAAQLTRFEAIAHQLGQGSERPSVRAAETVLQVMGMAEERTSRPHPRT